MPRKSALPPKPARLPDSGDAGHRQLQLSPEAQRLFDDVDGQWELTPPVRAMLRLAAECLTKAAHAEAITAREGMTIGDAKGAAKPHPAALLARDYRAQAASTLQRILTNLGAT